jgi:hypothetical protein
MTLEPHPQPELPACTLDVVLRAAQQTLFQEHPGLVQWLHRLPAARPREELGALLAGVHRELGEAQTRALLAAHGRALVEHLQRLPEFAALRARVRSFPEPERLEFAVHGAVALLARLGFDAAVTASRGAPLVSLERCPVCAEMPLAREPLCANVEVLLTALTRAFSGQAVAAAEVECQAEGGGACRFRIRG